MTHPAYMHALDLLAGCEGRVLCVGGMFLHSTMPA